MVWRWGLWEVSSHQSGALMNRISALQKGPQRPPRPIHHVGHSEKTAVREPESQPSLDTQTFQFRDQREINFCALYTSRSMLICHRLEWTKTHTAFRPQFPLYQRLKNFPLCPVLQEDLFNETGCRRPHSQSFKFCRSGVGAELCISNNPEVTPLLVA